MSRAELEKRILRLHKGGTGILKIGKALGIGTGTVQRILMKQPRPFDVGVAEVACASVSDNERRVHSGNPAFRRSSISSFAFDPPRAIHEEIVKAGSTSSRCAPASRALASRPMSAKADARHR
jgi:hypothetical protein